MPRTCSRGHTDQPINGVCPACLLIAEGNADRLEHLRAEVLWYLEGFVGRNVYAAGDALERLRKAVNP